MSVLAAWILSVLAPAFAHASQHPAKSAGNGPSGGPALRVVFIDAGVEQPGIIAAAALPGSLVHFLDSQDDPIASISRELARLRDAGKRVGALHIVSHGHPGAVVLAGKQVSGETLDARKAELAGWRDSFSPSPEIFLYGCETAAGKRGLRFLERWAELTGAAISASSTPTGGTARGGDWNLETTVGKAMSGPAFDTRALESYPATLPDYLFYHNGGAARLFRSDLDGSNTNSILAYTGSFQISAHDAVLVDPIRTNIYYNRIFNDSNRGLYKATYAGGSPIRISPNTNNLLSGISLDLANGKIYLHDDTAGRWYRMNLDGTEPTVLQSIASTGAFSAVDYKNNAFYYTQTVSGPTRGLYKTDLDMTTTGTLITTGGNQISGLAADMRNDKIYYYDYTLTTIYRAELDGSNPSSMLALSSSHSAVALTVDPVNQRMYYSAAAGNAFSSLRGIYRTDDMSFSNPTKISLHGTEQLGPVGITTYYEVPVAITGVTGPSAGNYKAGAHLDFTVTFASAVDVTGTPYLPLTVGGASKQAGYVSGSGSTALVFRYTVQAGDSDGDGIASSSPLVLNGGSIKKTGGSTDGGTTFSPPTTTSVLVDTTAPSVSIGSPSSTFAAGGPVSFTVTYSDAHFSSATLNAGDITVNSTGTASPSIVTVTGSGTTRTVTLSGITGDGTLGISVASGTAADTAGNTADSAGPSSFFAVDNTSPTVSISAPSAGVTAGGPVSFTVTYSDANFSSATLNAGDITVNSIGATSPSIVTVTGSGTTRTVTLSGITGDGMLGISVASGTAYDMAGNVADPAGPSSFFVVDNTAPAVLISAPSVSSTSGSDVTYTVTYSDDRFNEATLNAGDVTLNSTGTATGTVGISGTGTTRTVAISGISGSGTLGISIATGTASDTAGNLAAATGPSTTFTVLSGPTATTVGATNITVTGATLLALVNPNGESTAAFFESGTNTAYGTVSPVTLSPDDGGTEQPLALELTGLTPGTAYHFRIVATNSSGQAVGADLDFTTAANTGGPTDLGLDTNSVPENLAAGTVVGTLSATDPDAGDTATFALVSGTGDTDNASFSIDGNTLKTGAAFDFEMRTGYSIRVRATDAGGLFFEKQLTVTVTDVNEAPVFSGYFLTVAPNTPATVSLAKLLARTSDPEGVSRLVTGADTASEQGGTVQLTARSFTYTPPSGYTGSDSFHFTISDGVNFVQGLVQVGITGPVGNGLTLISMVPSGDGVRLTFAGIPGRGYRVQHATTLDPAATWTTLDTISANTSGFLIYTHSSPPSPSYWRVIPVL